MTVPAPTLAEVLSLREEIAVLRAQIAWFKQKLFGGGQGGVIKPVQEGL